MSENQYQKLLNYTTQNFFKVQLLNKLFHWNTTSYGKHKATDEFGSKFSELTDKFIEVFIGNYKVKPNLVSKFKIKFRPDELTDERFILYLVELVKFLKINIGKSSPMDISTDLQSINDEILAEVNKLLYLLTLN
jgi:hypothetical protein